MTIDTKSFSEQVLDQASAWIVRLRSDQVTEQDQQDFALWLAESEQHQKAFDEMMVLWEAMGSTTEKKPSSSVSALLGKVSADNGPSASNDGDSAASAGDKAIKNKITALQQSSQSSTAKQNSKLKRRGLIAGLGAIAASALVVGIFSFTGPEPSPANPATAQTLFATPIGKQQRFVLEDGSAIELNTDSKVSVEYTDNARKLHLIQGEAYFEVEPDPNRPFTVTGGRGQVTAVGTEFNIQLKTHSQPGAMLVAVTEGTVAVAKTGSPLNSGATQVDIGHQIDVTSDGELGNIVAADLELVSAWREKTLIFRNSSLSSALVELNRYLPNPVDTSDPSLDSLNISGTFSLDEPEATLGAIVDAFELQSYKNPFDSRTRLYRR